MMASRGKLLLTGGRGMVGRNIQEHPLASEWDIVAPGSDVLNLTDPRAVEAYVRAEKPDLVIHAAGRVGGIQANMANPVAFLDENVAMGRNIVMSAHKAGVPRFLNLASTCMYPRAAPNPLGEDMILTGELEPTNEGYALAKIVTTRLCQYIQRENPSLQYKTIIPCNLYGRHDKFDPKHSHLVPAIIHKLYVAKTQGATEVDIWGDGTARREFLYAGDLADAVLRAAANMESLPDLINIGLGSDFSINEYYEAAADVIGWQGTFVHDLTKPVGMKQKLSSVGRQTAWGWKPQTTLADGLRKTYAFYLERNPS
ncbi:GDP-L-fucose synthase family protein [Rhizobium sp. TRM96647]|uniref:GDP-L-fucose synthase family protein n=2 Tax=unclassified Rhizobium TaxID=2613769 RepID=UPI0021E898FB|nr:GDP-L-fucose synthase [Rhizobium sp. TRM96647]